MTRRHWIQCSLALVALVVLTGCEKRGDSERFGKTFYLDGAGNWGFGTESVPEGLKKAGYNGDVEHFVWTMSFNPLLDQLAVGNAKVKGKILAHKMDDYARRFPKQKINVIALSAGTGVAMWAIENTQIARVNNVILVGSSLSSTYDARRALRRIDGKLMVYSSRKDNILEIVRSVGTIDGRHGVSSAGAVGLHPPGGGRGKVVNIYWNENWKRYGWSGTHVDCTSEKFVRSELSRHVITRSSPSTRYSEYIRPNAIRQ